MTKLYGLIKKWKVIVYSLSLENKVTHYESIVNGSIPDDTSPNKTEEIIRLLITLT